MLGKTIGQRLERSFKRTSGRVTNGLKHSPLNGRGPALVGALAGATGIAAAMRFWRRDSNRASAFHVLPNEEGGWLVQATEPFGSRRQAQVAARKATKAMLPIWEEPAKKVTPRQAGT